ncbi:hypothetical protein D5S18_18950 [Nocardia panacis]|uniref:Uncharacterized protein n=2 Tax=Nocardia panacis TaxID=2340916 RepID=A0A3A4KFW3_9NOCA|nr:hypothetical protein D5S18_18950 [Nocardia panacis]
MIGAVAADAEAMARFGELVRRVWARWPPTTTRSGRFRLYTAIMYWQVLGHIAAGRVPDPHYYQKAVAALTHAWTAPQAAPGLIDRLTEIITATTGEHR